MSSDGAESTPTARPRGTGSLLRKIMRERSSLTESNPPLDLSRSSTPSDPSSLPTASSTTASSSSQSWRPRKRPTSHSSEIDMMEEKFARLKSPTKDESQPTQDERPGPNRTQPLRQLCMDVDEVNEAPLPVTSSISTPPISHAMTRHLPSKVNHKKNTSLSASFASSALVPSSLQSSALTVSGEIKTYTLLQAKRYRSFLRREQRHPPTQGFAYIVAHTVVTLNPHPQPISLCTRHTVHEARSSKREAFHH